MATFVTKENWPEVKQDLESGIARMRFNDDGDTVYIATESFNGYDIPLRFLKQLQRKGDLPESLLKRLGKV